MTLIIAGLLILKDEQPIFIPTYSTAITTKPILIIDGILEAFFEFQAYALKKGALMGPLGVLHT